jgi:hypothetical protein
MWISKRKKRTKKKKKVVVVIVSTFFRTRHRFEKAIAFTKLIVTRSALD